MIDPDRPSHMSKDENCLAINGLEKSLVDLSAIAVYEMVADLCDNTVADKIQRQFNGTFLIHPQNDTQKEKLRELNAMEKREINAKNPKKNGEEDGVVNDRRLNNLENLRDAAPRVDIARCCSFLKSSNGRDSTMASAKHLCAASII